VLVSDGANDKAVLASQRNHWENTFLSKPEMFGRNPGYAGLKAGENSRSRMLARVETRSFSLARGFRFTRWTTARKGSRILRKTL